MCSRAVYKALTAVPTVQAVTSNVETSEYRITFKPGAAVSIDDLRKAVEDAGFSVGALRVTANFPAPVAVENDTHLAYLGDTYHFLDVKKQTLSGVQTFRVVDKSFLPAKDFKRYAKTTAMPCVHTGTMKACCAKSDGAKPASTRVYHVTLL